jgi:dihydrofolate reductase
MVDWQTFGPEFAHYSVEQLDEIDTLVLGRATYEELAAYRRARHRLRPADRQPDDRMTG